MPSAFRVVFLIESCPWHLANQFQFKLANNSITWHFRTRFRCSDLHRRVRWPAWCWTRRARRSRRRASRSSRWRACKSCSAHETVSVSYWTFFQYNLFFVATATQLVSLSTSPHPMNRARRWYTDVTLLYDLC